MMSKELVYKDDVIDAVGNYIYKAFEYIDLNVARDDARKVISDIPTVDEVGDEQVHEMIVRLKSGREIHFTCGEWEITTQKSTGVLTELKFKNIHGELMRYFRLEDIEVIIEIYPPKKENEDNDHD